MSLRKLGSRFSDFFQEIPFNSFAQKLPTVLTIAWRATAFVWYKLWKAFSYLNEINMQVMVKRKLLQFTLTGTHEDISRPVQFCQTLKPWIFKKNKCLKYRLYVHNYNSLILCFRSFNIYLLTFSCFISKKWEAAFIASEAFGWNHEKVAVAFFVTD